MTDIIVHALNAVHNVIESDAGIAADLHDYFSFDVPGAHYIINRAKYRANLTGQPVKFSGWNGKINLFNKRNHKLYAGLNQKLANFAEANQLTIEFDYNPLVEFSVDDARKFIQTLNIPDKYDERYYQLNSFVHCVQNRRNIILAPTGSGKSIIIYQLIKYFMNQPKVLFIVPTIGLLHQIVKDVRDYGWEFPEEFIHQISAGIDKDSNHGIYVSTWQSIYELPKDYFKQFRTVMIDEVHGADAKSLKGIMEKLTLCPNRFGFTGTLKDTLCHKLVLEGLFGPPYIAATTTELIEAKYLSDLTIKCLILQYNQDICQKIFGKSYADEIDFLVNHEPRNNFIKNLTLSLNGNILLLFRKIDHGKILFDKIKKEAKNKSVHLIYGGVPGEEREMIRQILNTEKNAILVGSYGTVSTGIDIPSLQHVILGSPYKSRIKVLQSIGRGLRPHADKEKLTVYDVVDDMTRRTKRVARQNYTLKHFINRISIYNEEGFDYKTYRIGI